jgi:hypothetical protein
MLSDLMQKIADAFGVPPGMLKLGFPDTQDAYALCSELVDCPANNSPYVPGQLSANAYLTHKNVTAQQLAAAFDVPLSALGLPGEEPEMPHKNFDPEGSAHPELSAKTVFQGLGVSIAALDPDGKPTGKWHDLSNHASGLAVDYNQDQLTEVKFLAPDHMHFEFEFTPAAAENILESLPPVTFGHYWCTEHDQHWMDPAHSNGGDIIECQSGGYLRNSTPAEDKLVVMKRRAEGLE